MWSVLVVLRKPLVNQPLLVSDVCCQATPLDALSLQGTNEPFDMWFVFWGMRPSKVVVGGLGFEQVSKGSKVLATVVGQDGRR